jgi:hypothetical protein
VFSGWPDTRVRISLKEIVSVEKEKMFFLPNALTVKTSDGEDYFFGSFLDRDLCYRMLTSMVMIEKSLVELTGEGGGGTKITNDDNNPLLNNEAGGAEALTTQSGMSQPSDAMDVVDSDETDDESLGSAVQAIDYMSLFNTNYIASINETEVEISSSVIWKTCWREKSHFR